MSPLRGLIYDLLEIYNHYTPTELSIKSRRRGVEFIETDEMIIEK